MRVGNTELRDVAFVVLSDSNFAMLPEGERGASQADAAIIRPVRRRPRGAGSTEQCGESRQAAHNLGVASATPLGRFERPRVNKSPRLCRGIITPMRDPPARAGEAV
jgi:hypothetical protein